MTEEEPAQPLPPGESPYERHVFVCVGGKTCPTQGSDEVRVALRFKAFEKLGKTAVRVNKAGCMSQCGHGPMVVVYPDNVWYAGVRPEDAEEIVEEHLLNNRPVERLLYRGHLPGKNVIAPPDPQD